jgi:predicted choloylglycine hydrolase
VSRLRKTFRALEIGDGGDGRWTAHARALWPRAEEWMTDESRTAEGADRARALFETHMPELVPVLERLARQLDRPGGETFLTLAALRPFFSGCTQIVLRYLLETCDTVDEAVGRLRSLPIAIPQNVTLVDSEKSVTVFVGPDIPLTEAPDACAANHQHLPVPDDQERFTRTQERLSTVRATGTDVAAMLKPPLYQYAYDEGLGTVYTAHYRPAEGRATYHWPDETWEQSFTGFTTGSRAIALGQAG